MDVRLFSLSSFVFHDLGNLVDQAINRNVSRLPLLLLISFFLYLPLLQVVHLHRNNLRHLPPFSQCVTRLLLCNLQGILFFRARIVWQGLDATLIFMSLLLLTFVTSLTIVALRITFVFLFTTIGLWLQQLWLCSQKLIVWGTIILYLFLDGNELFLSVHLHQLISLFDKPCLFHLLYSQFNCSGRNYTH